MIFATALKGDHEELREQHASSQNLTGNCRHALLTTMCGICTPFTTQAVTEVVDYLDDGCVICGATIEQPSRGRKRVYCVLCGIHDNGARTREQHYRRRLEMMADNVALSHLRAFKYLTQDARWEGPDNTCFTVVTSLRFDRGFRAMPVDVHVNPIKPTKNLSAVELHDLHAEEQHKWEQAERNGRSTGLLRPKTNFCPHCSDARTEVIAVLVRRAWVEKKKVKTEDVVEYKTVKHTSRGRYVTQGHICNS